MSERGDNVEFRVCRLGQLPNPPVVRQPSGLELRAFCRLAVGDTAGGEICARSTVNGEAPQRPMPVPGADGPGENFLAIHSITMHSMVMITKELVAASTEPLILSLLTKGESYGYALIQEVKRLSGDKIEWTDGMLYPVLHRMEREGWLRSRWGQAENGRKRKYYSLKRDGHKALKEQRDQWATVSNVFGQLWKEHYV